MVSLLLNLNGFYMFCSGVSVKDYEQVNAGLSLERLI